MERAKIIKKVKNLQKIKSIVEIAKFDTIQKIARTTKIKGHHYEMAELSKKVLAFAKWKHRLSVSLAKRIKKQVNARTLWIFITVPSFLIKMSTLSSEKIIKNNFNYQHDSLIAVGNQAIKFAKLNNINIVATFEEFYASIKPTISLTNLFIAKKEFDAIKVVATTPRIKNKPFMIFPIKLLDEDKKEFDKITFYYSLSESLNNISNNYIENTLHGIYEETMRHYYKEKLIKHEASSKNIDQRIQELKQNLYKINKKMETEEMIQLTQLTKIHMEN